MGARLLPQSYQYPNLSEGTDRIDGQLGGDKECPFSGVTNLAEFGGRSQKAKLSVPRSLTSLLVVCGDLRLLQQRSSHAVNEVTAERVGLVSQSVDQGHCLFRQRDPELVLFLRACRAVGRVEQK